MLPRKRTWGGALLLLLVGVAVYYAWLGLNVHSELEAAQVRAKVVKAALADGDGIRSKAAARSFREAIDAAERHTGSFGWRVLGRLPVVGKDARAVREISAVGADLGIHVLRPIVAEMEPGRARALAPRGGRIDLRAVEHLGPVLERVAEAVDACERRLQAVHATSLTPGVGRPFRTATAEIASAARTINIANRAARVLPTMLGADGRKDYLLLQENNAEIRANGGGIAGAFSEVVANRGRITLARQGSTTDFPKFRHPVLPQSEAERRIYGTAPAEYLQDVNMVPEFSRTAELARAMFEQRFGQHLDGVFSMDTVTLSYLLSAAGPLPVAGGPRLTGPTAVDELLNRAYIRHPTPSAQDAYFRRVAAGLFWRVIHGDASWPRLVTALVKGAEQGRVLAHSFAPEVQRQLRGTEVAGGSHLTASNVPSLGVYLNDATGGKMSYFLRDRLYIHSDRCDGGQQELSSHLDLHMLKPRPNQLTPYVTGAGRYGVRPGDQLLIVRLYGPEGGELSDFRFNGKPVDVDAAPDGAREAVTVLVHLAPDAPVRVGWTIRTAVGQQGRLQVDETPPVTPTDRALRVASSC